MLTICGSALLSSTCFLLLIQTIASAVPRDDYHHRDISCAEFTIPVAISASNLVFKEKLSVDSNIDAVTYAWQLDTWSHPNLTDRVLGRKQIQDTFKIRAQLCTPQSDSKGVLQIATHSAGFDKRYWDVEEEPETYSYVLAAVRAGYSILTYDRLGTGESDKPDAYDIVQLPLQVEILKELTIMSRSGSLAAMANPQFSNGITCPSFSKVVHVGHSLGSVRTGGLLSSYPDLSDGAIETGFIVNQYSSVYKQASWGWQFAPENDPHRFGDRGSGYIVPGTASSMQQSFLSNAGGVLDPKMVDYAHEIKQPATVGVFMSTVAVAGRPAPDFRGPLQVFLAEYDYPLCGGDCKGAFEFETLQGQYPAASVEVYIQPGSGHGLPQHKNATARYQVMFDFLKRNGL